MDILPDELTAFIQAFKEKSNSSAITQPDGEPVQNDEEDIDDEK